MTARGAAARCKSIGWVGSAFAYLACILRLTATCAGVLRGGGVRAALLPLLRLARGLRLVLERLSNDDVLKGESMCPGEDVVQRALRYPYERPAGSFTFVNGSCVPFERETTSLSRLHVVLAIGSNAAPEQLLRKYGKSAQPMHVVAVQVHGMDVVYGALMAPYGSIPATVASSDANSACSIHASLLTDEHLQQMHQTESGYYFCKLLPNKGVRVLMEGRPLSQPVFAYVARNGPFCVNGRPVALAEIRAEGRALEQLTQTQMMHAVRQHVGDALPLEQFVLANVKHKHRRRAIAQQLKSNAQLEDCWQLQLDLGRQ